ncbi:hypothetical protein S83_019348 [Arachis hypogaea]
MRFIVSVAVAAAAAPEACVSSIFNCCSGAESATTPLGFGFSSPASALASRHHCVCRSASAAFLVRICYYCWT